MTPTAPQSRGRTGSDADSGGSQPAPPGLRAATAAFRHRNFSLFWFGALVSNTGTWVQNITVPFVVYQLTDSPAWVGFAGFAQFFTAWLMGPLGGSVADRFRRQTILLVTQIAMAGVAFVLWGVWVSGVRSPWTIIGLTAVLGLIGGFNIPSWQAFVSELVPRDTLLNAVTLNSAQFNASRAFGPAVGGVVLATLGPGAAFLINAVSFAAVIGALVAIRLPDRHRPPRDRPRVLAEFVATARYVRAQPGISTCVLAVLALGFFGSPIFTLLVVFAEDVFEVGEGAFGLLAAGHGVGAILGTPFIAGWGGGTSRGRLLFIAMVAYGGAITAFGLAPTYLLGFAALLVAGAGYLAVAATLNTTIQLQVDEAMRGRVLAFYVMGLTGTMPLGSLLQGWTAGVVGPRPTVVVAGLAFLAVTALLVTSGRLSTVSSGGAEPFRTDSQPASTQPR